MRSYSTWVLMVSMAILALPAAALEQQQADRVSFEVEAGTEVDNDWTRAVLSISAEHKVPAELADQINRTMRWAMEKTREVSRVKVGSGNYQTYPVYDDRKIVNWRARQELYLESQELEPVTALIGVLQERLQMQSLQFSVSPGRKSAVEEVLIEDALTAFQKRAALISKTLGARDYRLLEVAITTGGSNPVVPLRAELAMAGRAAVSEPALESGTSRITVLARGAIQLLRD